jgi:GntR family transcriptional regulator, carbon starvation induced regulator
MTRPVDNLVETRAGDVLQRMRSDIIACVLKPGTKLRFGALRDKYEASFSTLREALSRLVAEGLVASEEHRGFVVAPVSRADLEDLTDVRVLVEKECMMRSTVRGDDAWEADILAAFHRMDRLQQRLGPKYYLSDEWAGLHGSFHFALVNACGSPNLLEFRQTLFARAHRYRRISSQFRPYWRPKETQHKAIMEAVLARNAPKATRLIERHIRETTENVLEHAAHLFEPEDQDQASLVAKTKLRRHGK